MPLNKRIEDSCICNICGKFCREENAKCGKPFFFFEVIRLSFKGKRMRTDYIHNIIYNAFYFQTGIAPFFLKLIIAMIFCA